MPVLLASTLIIGTMIILLCFIGLADLSSRILGPVWARLNAAVMMMSITVEGREHIAPDTSYVLTANHLSLVDIYVLYGYIGLNFKWVMKQELRKVPVLGLACDLMGHIYVDRSNPDAARLSIERARARINQGMCIIFFPEGTRSRTQQLRPFKSGAFRMAQDLNIAVVPISIHGTNKILPSDTLDWRPGKVKLIFHPPQAVNQQTEASELARLTREIIQQSLTKELGLVEEHTV